MTSKHFFPPPTPMPSARWLQAFALLAVAHTAHADVNILATPLVRNAAQKYLSLCETRPIVSNMVTGGILACMGDALMQGIEQQTAMRQPGDTGKHEYDMARTARFLLFRVALVAPLYTMWLSTLEALPLAHLPPIQKAAVMGAMDLLLFSPPLHCTFFASQALWEGEDAAEAFQRCASMLPKTLPVSWCFWAPTQLITFSVVPPPLRVAFVNSASLAWNTVMSSFNQLARRGHHAAVCDA